MGQSMPFWLFSFERYNGILGSYRTNNRSIEVQLMRHFVQEMEISKLHIRDENYTAHSIVQELDQTAAVVGTLNDMLAQFYVTSGNSDCIKVACMRGK